MVLNVNTDAAVIFSNKLERMGKNAFPVAVRGALNKAAFDVKQDTMPRSASRNFVNRQKNFFKANSRVEMAKGKDLRSMKSTVGFIEHKLTGSNNYAVKDLEQQERGGRIQGRSFIPTKISRGGNTAKPVRPSNRITKVQRLVNAAKGKGKNKSEKFVRSAIHAGKGGYIIDNGILWRITSLVKRKVKLRGRSSRTIVRVTPLHSWEENRSVQVKGTGFMKEASLQSASKIEKFYIQEANRQIEKLRNK